MQYRITICDVNIFEIGLRLIEKLVNGMSGAGVRRGVCACDMYNGVLNNFNGSIKCSSEMCVNEMSLAI